MAKGMCNGLPMGAVVTTKAIADAMNENTFFNTFAAGPVPCMAGIEVLKIMEEENLQAAAKKLGARLVAGLSKVKAGSRHVGDVRGQGLLVGVDLVKSQESKEPNPELAARVLEGLREKGVLAGLCGEKDNVVRFSPPLCLGEADVDFAVGALQECLKAG
jgi:alanine-glyoxylate transaminase/(R)-3-amino-2-methylpropionate-pyruvate transaminase